MKSLYIASFLLLASFYSISKPRTVVLDVPTMNCVTCPITVRKSLENVDGVSNAEVVYDDKSATVTFDDEKTNVKSLIEATTNAGYPSVEKTVSPNE
jgi:periplasmic mercuric ion binding protein